MAHTAKTALRLVRRPDPLKAPSIDTMTPGDLLQRLAIISPDMYRAVIAIARERYRSLWPFEYDILPLRTGTDR